MGSTKRILEFRKREHEFKSFRPDSAHARLIRLVAQRTRLGNQIKLDQIGRVPSTPEEEKLYERIQMERKKIIDEQKEPKKFGEIKAKLRTVLASKQLRSALQRPPTVFEVLAVTALKHGFDSEELRRQVTAMSTIYIRHRNEVTWNGTPSNIDKVIKRKLPTGVYALPAIEHLLHSKTTTIQSKKFGEQKAGIALTSKEIAENIGLNPRDPKTQNTINAALQFLEICGLVRKMPDAAANTHRFSTWMHRSHRNPKIDYENIGMHILLQAHSGENRIGRIYKQHHAAGRYGRIRKFGSETGKHSMKAIYLVARKLEEAGLITIIPGVRKETDRGFPITTIELTEFGKEMMKKYEEEQSLPEVLRKLLLGENKKPVKK